MKKLRTYYEWIVDGRVMDGKFVDKYVMDPLSIYVWAVDVKVVVKRVL